jgi:hypothetical protein
MEKFQVSLKSGNTNGYFQSGQIYIFIISRSILLRMINVLDIVVGKTNTHFIFNNLLFSKIVLFV